MTFTAILTVGNVKNSAYDGPGMLNYNTLKQAIDSAPAGALIAVAAGAHLYGGINLFKQITIIGLGNTPDETALTGGNSMPFTLSGNADLTLENITFRSSPSGWTQLFQAWNNLGLRRVTANRCLFDQTGNSLNQGFFSSWLLNAGLTTMRFTHCSFLSAYCTFRRYELGAISLEKCLIQNPNFMDCTGTLAASDYVTSATDQYGHQYGQVEQNIVDVSQQAIDLRDNQPVTATLFDWFHPQTFMKAATDADREWRAKIHSGQAFGIYHLSRDNRCPPIIHGPYTAE